MFGPIASQAYNALTAEDDGRVCRDIPDEACEEQPRHFATHVLSLAATKTGDGLADPKLVLSWLLTTLGAPAAAVGVLVPVRESGALLPQLLIADWVRRRAQRKWVWATGSLVQGVSVAAMGVAALLLDGAAAGWTIVACLAVFAIARSFCSVSYKDVLGKTIGKSTRGTTTGTAATVAACFVLTYGVLLAVGVLPRTVEVVAIGLFVAAGLWLTAAGLFSTLVEKPGSTEGGRRPIDIVIEQFGMLRRDSQLRRFIGARGLLTATALAPPYFVGLSDSLGGTGELGRYVSAAALAAVLSTYVWGRLSDRSSRRVLIIAGAAGGVVLLLTAGAAWMDLAPSVRGWVLAALLFLLMLAYQGVRLGRSTHLVDMADEDTRAPYTAISNTAIGLLLLCAAGFGAVAEILGREWVLVLFAAMSFGGAIVAVGLREEQA